MIRTIINNLNLQLILKKEKTNKILFLILLNLTIHKAIKIKWHILNNYNKYTFTKHEYHKFQHESDMNIKIHCYGM